MRRAFVTGWPVDHSRSPLIHNYWLKLHGIEGAYEKRACEPENFSKFLTDIQREDFVGGNVTLPFKEQVIALAEETDEVARTVGAANTVWLEDGKLHATNTDVYGFLANLKQQLPGWDETDRRVRGALVLGAGGASRAIIHGLLDCGFDRIGITNRTASKAEELAHTFGLKCEAVDPQDLSPAWVNPSLVVNTTSVGMGDGAAPIDPSGFAEDTIVNDIVYAPLITPLLRAAKQAGMPVADGVGMLLHQAVPGFERWFGVRPEVTSELRNLVLADLGESG